MHEASVAQGLLRVALEELAKYRRQHPGRTLRLAGISCELGLLSCVEEQTLKGCFEIMAEDTEAAGIEPVFARAPLACVCAACGADFELRRREFVCPRCGAADIRFAGGHGLALTGIAVECEDNGS